ncbi:MAG: HmuY family protein [Bacteroidota bacterium]
MNSIKSLLSIGLLATMAVIFTACKDDSPAPDPVIATTTTDLAADPGTGIDPNNGQPTGITNKFTLFSFKTGEVVLNADSATTKWDVGFRRTTIIVNGGTSGSGAAGAIVKSGLFDEILEAPADGYAVDDKNSTTSKYAIPTGSGNGWYTYDGGAQVIKPTAGKVLIFKTADNRYAKVEILSYYQGAKTNPVNTDVAGYYTFRYVYQPNDSKSFN